MTEKSQKQSIKLSSQSDKEKEQEAFAAAQLEALRKASMED